MMTGLDVVMKEDELVDDRREKKEEDLSAEEIKDLVEELDTERKEKKNKDGTGVCN